MAVTHLAEPNKRYLRLVRRVLPLAIVDIFILWVSYATVYSVRMAALPLDLGHGILFPLFVTFTTLIFLYGFGAYHRIWAYTSGHEVAVIVKAVVLSALLIGALDFVLRPRPIPLSVVLVGDLLALCGFVAIRYRSRLISGLSWRWRAIWYREFPQTKARVLIIGAGEAGQTTAWRLKHRFSDGKSGYRVIGFVDDDPAKQGMYVEGCPVLGNRTAIPRLVEEHSIDLVVVAVHNISGVDFRDVLNYCEQTGARIKIVPDVWALLNGRKGSPLLRDVQAEDLLGRQTMGRCEAVDLTPVTQKTVLVTGAAGSIGSELCRQLLFYNPVKLILLDSNESGLHDLMVELGTGGPQNNLVLILADITQRDGMERVFAVHKPQVVFHAAAYKHVPMLEWYPHEAIRVNVGGTLQVAELARDYGAERFVLISTDKAVNPTSVMGASKRICELMMHTLAQQGAHNTLFTSVRFGNVLGSRGSVVSVFNHQIEAGGPVTVTSKDMTRYFMTIPESVNLVIHAACMTQGDDLFMLNMGEVVRIVELAERMIRLRGLRPYEDVPIEFIGTRPGEKLHEELRDEAESMIPTPHPSIVQLLTHQNGFCPDTFWKRMNDLLTNGINEGENSLERLVNIINGSHSPM